MSDPTGKRDFHGDVDAVRAANAEDPHRKVRHGGPAVVPGSAREDGSAPVSQPAV